MTSNRLAWVWVLGMAGAGCGGTDYGPTRCSESTECGAGAHCIDGLCRSPDGVDGAGSAGGSAGEAGSGGAGGSAGEAGTGGAGGSAGEAGSGGTGGGGGSAGEAGSGGAGGSAGEAGSGGTGGAGGAGGAGGGPVDPPPVAPRRGLALTSGVPGSSASFRARLEVGGAAPLGQGRAAAAKAWLGLR